MRYLQWSYRTPPLDTWWRVLGRAIGPLGEFCVLLIAIAVIYFSAALLVIL